MLDLTIGIGAGGRNRTRDPLITSQVLYQLSYTGEERRIMSRLNGFGKPSTRLFGRFFMRLFSALDYLFVFAGFFNRAFFCLRYALCSFGGTLLLVSWLGCLAVARLLGADGLGLAFALLGGFCLGLAFGLTRRFGLFAGADGFGRLNGFDRGGLARRLAGRGHLYIAR